MTITSLAPAAAAPAPGSTPAPAGQPGSAAAALFGLLVDQHLGAVEDAADLADPAATGAALTAAPAAAPPGRSRRCTRRRADGPVTGAAADAVDEDAAGRGRRDGRIPPHCSRRHGAGWARRPRRVPGGRTPGPLPDRDPHPGRAATSRLAPARRRRTPSTPPSSPAPPRPRPSARTRPPRPQAGPPPDTGPTDPTTGPITGPHRSDTAATTRSSTRPPRRPRRPDRCPRRRGLTPVVATVTGAASATPTSSDAATRSAVLDQVLPALPRVVLRGEGTSRLTLKLHPADLGEVHVTVTVRGQEVDVTLAAGARAREALSEGSVPAARPARGHRPHDRPGGPARPARRLAPVPPAPGQQPVGTGPGTGDQAFGQARGQGQADDRGQGFGRPPVLDGGHTGREGDPSTHLRPSGTVRQQPSAAAGIDVTI